MQLAELAQQSATDDKLSAQAIAQLLDVLGGSWRCDAQTLRLDLATADMVQAATLAACAAAIAEQLNHHPDITLGYRRFALAITTHDRGGLTMLDFVFAARFEIARSR